MAPRMYFKLKIRCNSRHPRVLANQNRNKPPSAQNSRFTKPKPVADGSHPVADGSPKSLVWPTA
ncbi:hypothetical protein Hanom_Chr12g01091961 [Helianthus anomalus]